MRLYFLRHGPARLRSSWKGDDADRPLTAKGERRVRRVAHALLDLQAEPALILTSPYARAAKTAEITADVMGIRDRVAQEPRLQPGFDVAGLQAILAAHPDVDTLMLVGHEPDFSLAIADLVGGGRVAIRKAGVARVDLDGPEAGAGVLVWLTSPECLGA